MAVQFIVLGHDRVHRANFFGRWIDPIETTNHRRLMRRSHTQTAQIPIKLTRTWMRHAAHE